MLVISERWVPDLGMWLIKFLNNEGCMEEAVAPLLGDARQLVKRVVHNG